MLERFLIFWLLLICVSAFFWPALPGELDPFLSSAKYLPQLFAVTMFSIGSLLPAQELREIRARWPLVLAGTALQYLSMPALAWSCSQLFPLSADHRAGLVLVGCVPGAMASNVLTLVARGNVSYSVCLTTMATLLSPLIVPWTLFFLLGKQYQISPLEEFWRLLWMVVLPVMFGHLLSRFSSRWKSMMARLGPIVANLSILWIIAVVVAGRREHAGQLSVSLITALLVLNLVGYLIGYFGGRGLGMTESMRRALALEIGMQNAGLGAVMAAGLFPNTDVPVPPALYTFGCMLTGTILVKCWATRQAKNQVGS